MTATTSFGRRAGLAVLVLLLSACSQNPSTQPQLEGLTGALPSALSTAGPDLIAPVDGEAEYGLVDGPFDVVLAAGNARLNFRFSGTVRANEIAKIKLRATSTDGGAVRGTVTVDFGDGTPAEVVDIRRQATLEHQYAEPGKYRVVASLNDDTGYAGKGAFKLNVAEGHIFKIDVIWDNAVQPAEPEQFGFNAYRSLPADSPLDAAAKCSTRGTLIVDFGDGETETVDGFSCYTTLNHTYRKRGDYKLKVKLAVFNGPEHSESYDVAVRNKTEPPPPPPPSGGTDAINAASVVVVETRAATDAFTWPMTRGISVSDFRSGSQRWSPDPAWPQLIIFGGPAQGILWIIRNVNGRYEASPVDWFLPGQTVQYLTQETMAGHAEYAWPGWAGPNIGDTMWFMLSTPGWVGARGITDERTNIVEVRWGQ